MNRLLDLSFFWNICRIKRNIRKRFISLLINDLLDNMMKKEHLIQESGMYSRGDWYFVKLVFKSKLQTLDIYFNVYLNVIFYWSNKTIFSNLSYKTLIYYKFLNIFIITFITKIKIFPLFLLEIFYFTIFQGISLLY